MMLTLKKELTPMQNNLNHTQEVEDVILTEFIINEYKKLNDKCDLIISKIKARKEKKIV